MRGNPHLPGGLGPERPRYGKQFTRAKKRVKPALDVMPSLNASTSRTGHRLDHIFTLSVYQVPFVFVSHCGMLCKTWAS